MLKKKIIISTATLLLFAATGTGVYAYNQKQYEAEQKSFIQKADYAVENLYNRDHTKLADHLDKKIKNAELAVGKVDDKKVKNQLSKKIKEVKIISKIQDEVYSTLENGILKEGVTEKQLEELYQELNKVEHINHQIYTELFNNLSEAKSQLIVIDEAKNKVKNSEQSLDRKTYNDALAIVDTIKNENVKKDLSNRLVAVNEKIVAKEEAQRKAEETKRQNALSQQQATAKQQQGTVTKNNGNSSVAKKIQQQPNSNSSTVQKTQQQANKNASNQQQSSTDNRPHAHSNNTNNYDLKPGDTIEIEENLSGETESGRTWEGGWTGWMEIE